MKKTPVTMQLEDDVCQRLDTLARAAGHDSKNAMLAQIAIIMSRIPPTEGEFLARISALSTPTRAAKPIALEVV